MAEPASAAPHKMYDVRDPANMSTSIATRSFQAAVQEEDIVVVKESCEEEFEEKGCIGLVTRTVIDDDDNSELDDGMVTVWWMAKSGEGQTGMSTSFAVSDLEVVDRAFQKGDVVAPYDNEKGVACTTRQGIVIDVDRTFTVQLLDGTTLLIDSSQMCGTYPLGNSMTTQLIPAAAPTPSNICLCDSGVTYVDIIIAFPDNCYCCITDASNDKGLEESDELYHPYNTGAFAPCCGYFYPGQVISNPKVFRHARYLVGKWKKAHKKGVVVKVIPFAVEARILVAADSVLSELQEIHDKIDDEGGVMEIADSSSESDEADDEANTDAEGHDAAADDTGDGSNDTVHQQAHSDDWSYASSSNDEFTFVVDPSLVHYVDDEPFGGTVGVVGLIDEALLAKIDKLKEHAKRTKDERAEAAASEPLDLVCKRSPLRAPRYFPPCQGWPVVRGRRNAGKLLQDKRLMAKRREIYRAAVKSKPGKALMAQEKRRVARILDVSTKVTVKWQDGAVVKGVGSKDLVSLHHTQEFEHFPGEMVLPSSQPMLEEIERQAKEKQPSHDASNGPLVHTMVNSCYDLKNSEDIVSLAVGDEVIYCPRVEPAHAAKDQTDAPKGEGVGGETAASEDEAPPTYWECTRCTLHNPAKVRQCDICHAARPRKFGRKKIPPPVPGGAMLVHLLNCSVIDYNKLGCVGVVRSVTAAARVASVNWVFHRSSDYKPPPEKGDASVIETRAEGIRVGKVRRVEDDGRVLVVWHSHGTGEDEEEALVSINDLIGIEPLDESEEDDEGETGDFQRDWKVDEARWEGETPESLGTRIFNWGKDVVKRLNPFKKGQNAEGGEEAPDAGATSSGDPLEDRDDDRERIIDEVLDGMETADFEGDGDAEEDDDETERFTVVNSFPQHTYIKQAAGKTQMARIHKEWKSFHRSLPPGIKVVASETQPHLLSTLIEGPLHTPYRNCIIAFDFFLRSSFPFAPPKATVLSYGLKLNPNLYSDGLICLSLLGTWSGVQSCEQWNSQQSTLLQVFISIQALVLTKEPYYNEAGYHNHLGTAEGRQNSRFYNEQVYLLCLTYMTMLLDNCPSYLKDDVHAFVEANWKGTLKRAEKYLEHVDEEMGNAQFTIPESKQRAEEGEGEAEAGKEDKRLVTQEELDLHSKNTTINEDGIILPVSSGFAVSLKTSALPRYRASLKAHGFIPAQQPAAPSAPPP